MMARPTEATASIKATSSCMLRSEEPRRAPFPSVIYRSAVQHPIGIFYQTAVKDEGCQGILKLQNFASNILLLLCIYVKKHSLDLITLCTQSTVTHHDSARVPP